MEIVQGALTNDLLSRAASRASKVTVMGRRRARGAGRVRRRLEIGAVPSVSKDGLGSRRA